MNINISNLTINGLDMKIFNRICRIFKRRRPKPPHGTGCHKYKSIKLIREYKDAIGVGFHRSGWPFAYKWLESIASKSGILVDDFIEQNFCYNSNPKVYKEPWIGIFHHPPTIPHFGNQRESLEKVFKSPEFKKSAKYLKLAICLSEHLGKYLRTKLSCPVLVVKHPVEIPKDSWTVEKYKANKNKSLIQVGYYLRNTQLINQIPPSAFNKIRFWLNRTWVLEYDERVEKYWTLQNTRRSYGDFRDIYFIPPSQYDKYLCENIIVQEVFDSSASNGVLDCIVRNTPLIVNKHPAVVEYLGENYPLYFKSPEEIPALAQKAELAHKYLANMDKSWVSGEIFVRSILQAVEKL